MRRPLPILAPLALLAALVALAAPAAGASDRTGLAPARGFVPGEVVVKFEGKPARTVAVPTGVGVREMAATLGDNRRVAYAEPNYIATASATATEPTFLPNDSGALEADAEAAASAGNWSSKQWNFLPWEGAPTARLPVSPGGIDAVGAWQNLAAVGRPGAQGVKVAVLDTGVAYRTVPGIFKRSPDFDSDQFLPGYDYVDLDPLPADENGHGTHIAGTIAEQTDNAIGLTGLAYNASLMPVRVLDQQGRGDAITIARGITFAVTRGANVINMSFNFACGKQVRIVDEALRYAYERGVVTVASAGNLGSETCVSEPATGPRVIAVGGSTEGGCLGSYSLAGSPIDLVAPGGGVPGPGCPSISARPIYQVTLRPGSKRVFAIPGNYVGTSMAAAHVSAAAAMVLAANTYGGPRIVPQSGQGKKLRVAGVLKRLRETARDLALPSTQQGAGLLDVGAATAPRGPQ